MEDLRGGDAQLNAQILMDVFGGQRGPVADALNLNAGVALAACQLADDARDGIKMAQVRVAISPACTWDRGSSLCWNSTCVQGTVSLADGAES